MTTTSSAASAGTAEGVREEEPTIDFRAMPRVLRRLGAMGLEHPWHVVAALAATLCATAAALVIPKLLGSAVDNAHTLLAAGGSADTAKQALWTAALLVIAAGTARGLFLMTQLYLYEWISQRVGQKLRMLFFEKLQRLSFGFHDKIHSGDLITRGMLDIEGARTAVSEGMLRVVQLSFLIGVAGFLLLSSDLTLGLIAMSFVPFAIWRLADMGMMLRITWMKMQQLMSQLTLVMEENLQGIRVVRAFASHTFEMAKFDTASMAALRLAYRRIRLRFSAVTTLSVAFYAAMGALLWVGGGRVIHGEMTVGHLTEFLTYMTLLQMPIRMVAMVVAAMARATSSGQRLFEILDIDPDIKDAPNAKDLAVSDGVLRFEHVSFEYVPGKQVLTDINFTLQPGKTLGIVGPPGSGKSTIAHLVPRFYDPSSGRVTIDGQDLRDVTLSSIRQAVSLIQQDTFLFDASVTNNVAYADPWAEEERIVDAASTAQIHEYVDGLPARYETRVGERGVALSGGQRQRMSIARGIVPGPAVFIFDDSTAAIDAVTERRVRMALADRTSKAGTIIIAHRLSSLMHADEIIMLDRGRIVERGTHAQLRALGGEYESLYQLQSRSDDDLDAPEAALEHTA
jgi:ATP-binding cassette subfamily B multidrug efflux pump